jgi:hypothetical protein
MLLFSTVLEHSDACVPYLHGFKNSVVAEIGLLHSQPFSSSHFQFFIIAEFATSQLLLQRPKQMEV